MATKISEELIMNIAKEVQDGLPICYACDLYEVSDTSYYNWMKQGEQDYNDNVQSLYTLLFVSIKKSYAQYVKDSTNRIKSGVPGWQGTAWLLERTNPKYMPKQQIQPDEDGKVVVNIGGKVKDIVKK